MTTVTGMTIISSLGAPGSIVVALSLGLGLSACGSPSGRGDESSSGRLPASDRDRTTPPPPSDPPASDADASGIADGGLDASTSPETSTLPALIAPAVVTDGILLTQATVDGTTFSSSASAFFTPISAPSPPAWCAPQAIAGCSVLDCDFSAAPTQPGTSTAPSAGTITFGGPLLGALGISLDPSPPLGLYVTAQRKNRLFAPGDLLSVAASGGDVPAFSGTVTAPNDVFVTAPALGLLSTLSVDRSASFPVAWTGGGGTGVVSVTLSTSHVNGTTPVRAVYVSCAALATTGALTMPAAAVAKLEPTSTNIAGFVTVESRNDAAVAVGTRTVVLRASTVTGGSAFTTVN